MKKRPCAEKRKNYKEEKLPFAELQPNKETVLAMNETNLKSFGNIDDLFADLHE